MHGGDSIMWPLILLLRLLCLRSIPLLIPDLLCWSHWICTDPPSIFFDLAPVHQLSIKWLCMTPLWLLEASLAPIWLPAFRIFGFLLHSWLTPLPIMLTDELTHCFTQQLINPSYAYSYMLIPCLPIDYKAPIVLLQIPQLLTHFCLLFLAYWSAYWSSPLLTDQLTHSLLICAYPIAYWLLTNPLLFSYQSPLLLQILLTPPYVYKLLLAVCQCKQSVPCFKVVLKTSLSLYCALSVRFCQPLSSLWVL